MTNKIMFIFAAPIASQGGLSERATVSSPASRHHLG